MSTVGAPAVSQELGAAQTMAHRYAVDSTPTVLVGRDANTLKKTGATAADIHKAVTALAPSA